MRVLIPVDGSVSCRNALDLLAARARRMQVKPEVSLINVQHPVPMGVMTQFGLDAVRAAAESGEIAKSRYESYLRMHEEARKINDWE